MNPPHDYDSGGFCRWCDNHQEGLVARGVERCSKAKPYEISLDWDDIDSDKDSRLEQAPMTDMLNLAEKVNKAVHTRLNEKERQVVNSLLFNKSKSDAMNSLGMSRAVFYKHLNRARQKMEDELNG